MDQPTRAERLPELYRAVLDAVSELERRGLRTEARCFRTRAARAYACWDPRAERRLARVLEDARRAIVPIERPAGLRGRLRMRLAGRRRTDAGSVVQPSI